MLNLKQILHNEKTEKLHITTNQKADVLSLETKYNLERIDFYKLLKLGYGMSVIVSQRNELGKTFRAKEFILSEWRKYGKRSIWMMNTKEQMDADHILFLAKGREENPETWENITATSKGLYDEKGKIFCYFTALSTSASKKGSRSNVWYVFYDEINVSINYVKKTQTRLLAELHSTTSKGIETNPVREFLFLNKSELGIPCLDDVGLTFKKKHNHHKMYGTKLCYIYNPKPNMDIIHQRYKKNWIYGYSVLAGMHNYQYGNEALIRDEHNVLTRMSDKDIANDMKPEEFYPINEVVKIDDAFYEVFMCNLYKDTKMYFRKAKGDVEHLKKICINKKSSDIGVIYNPTLRELFIRQFQNHDTLYFDTQSTKYLFQDSL